MKRKKSQVGQIFIYLISTLVVILVLYYGYAAIKGIGKKQEQLSLVKFQKAIEDTVVYTSSDYGTVRIETFTVPVQFSDVCFVDKNVIVTGNASQINEQQYTLIYNSVKDRVNKNVFPIPGGDPFYVDKVWVDEGGGFTCFNVAQGNIKVRIEGFGDRAKVSHP